jgi:hypothetical protein
VKPDRTIPIVVLVVAALALLVVVPFLAYRHGVLKERGVWEARVARMADEVREREEQDRRDVEEQNREDQTRIADLEARLAAALAPRPAPAPRLVRVCDDRPSAPAEAEVDAGGPETGGVPGRPVPDAADPWRGMLELRADLLRFAQECAAVRIAALSAKEQWPR